MPNFQVISLKDVPPRFSIPKPRQSAPVVLVVDDEQTIADTLSIILRKSGFTVWTAFDGESALEMVAVASPDLLLSDVMLGPGIDGTRLAMQVTEACPECKVLLFSGHAATMDLLEEARQAGHNFTLLTKPIHPADLLARITLSLAANQLALIE